MKIWYIWRQALPKRWFASEKPRWNAIEVVERAEYELVLARAIKAEDRLAKAKLVAKGLIEELEKLDPGYAERLEARVTRAEEEH